MQKLIFYIYIRHHLDSIIKSCKDAPEPRYSNCISNFHYYFSSKKFRKKNQTNSNLTSQRIPLQCKKKLSVFETSGLPTLNPYHLMRDLPPLKLVPLSQMAILLMKCLPSSPSLHYASVLLGPPFCSPYHVAG